MYVIKVTVFLFAMLLLGGCVATDAEDDNTTSKPSNSTIKDYKFIESHYQGENCLDCHSANAASSQRVKPYFAASGTIFSTYDAQNSSDNSANFAATILLQNAANNSLVCTISKGFGNFHCEQPLPSAPWRVSVLNKDGVQVNQSSGFLHDSSRVNCNACHRNSGINGAPGRIISSTAENPSTENSPIFTSSDALQIITNSSTPFTIKALFATSYTLESSGDFEQFTLNSSTGKLTFESTPDFKNPTDIDTDNHYNLTVVASNSNGLSSTQELTITVLADTAKPVFTTATPILAPLSSLIVADIDANDTSTIYFNLLDTPDASNFEINSSSGIIAFKEGSIKSTGTYSLVVIATDSYDNAASKEYAITITDETDSDAPVFTSSNSFMSIEGDVNVDTITVTDANPFVLSIASGADADLFTLTDNVLRFKDPTYLEDDANSDSTYTITLKAVDSSNNSAEQNLSIVMLADTTAPQIITSITSYSVNEGVTSVVSISATDEYNNTLTYSLVNTDAARFSIDTLGNLSFKNAPDYDNPLDSGSDNIYNVSVNVSDSATVANSSTIDLTVTVLKVVSYVNDVYPLLASPNCGQSGCHNSERATGFKMGSDAASSIANIKNYINDPIPEKTELLRKASATTSHGGSTTIKYDTTSTQYNTLKAWITDGAPNN